jgi:hypothetical protein
MPWLVHITPATWVALIRRITVQGQPIQKVSETPPISIDKLGMTAQACDPSYMGGHRWEDHSLKLDLGKISRPHL